MNLAPLTLLSAPDYFEEITHKISRTKKGDRVALMSMGFNPTEPLMAPLVRELVAAAKRGVHVQLDIDAISFMIDDRTNAANGPLLFSNNPTRTWRKIYKDKLIALEKLVAGGCIVHINNKPKRRPTIHVAGRTHIKYTVINHEAYLGGCNLNHTWQTDVMVRLFKPETVDWIYKFIIDAGQVENVRDFLQGKDLTIPIDADTTLFVDAGVKNQSIIYDHALDMIDAAKEWVVLTCQFFPGGRTAAHLAAASKRGVDVTVHFSPPNKQIGFEPFPHQLAQWREQLKHPKVLFSNPIGKNIPRLHAKLLATEQAAMIGSHNLVSHGVRLGTAETALLRHDPSFALQIVRAIENQLTA
jgi:phosphatidylserine/phosphatidylglycerophosphate/cardiolipin synthase-like enzyme